MVTITLNAYLNKIGYKGSLRELAGAIDYNREKLRRFASNEMKMYPNDLINSLCNYFQCEISDFMAYVEDDNSKELD